MENEKLTIDLTGCLCRSDIYDVLHGCLSWEEAYGRNLDAVWDILTGFPLAAEHIELLLPPEGEPDERISSYLNALSSVFERAAAEVGFGVTVCGRD